MPTTVSKEAVCLYLPSDLMRRVRCVSQEMGISMSRLALQGLEKQVEKWRSLAILTGDGEKVAARN